MDRPGLWREPDISEPMAGPGALVSDESREVAEAVAWIALTPKTSFQMNPQELHDARLETAITGERAVVVASLQTGPWKHLKPSRAAIATRLPLCPRSLRAAELVQSPVTAFCIPAGRLLHPGLIEANRSFGKGLAVATMLDCEAGCRLAIDARI